MPKRIFRIREGEPLLDIVSYGRGGPRENGGRLTPEQVEQIRRTVQRVPEVMVKVLPRASNDLKAAGKHLDYISRYGRLALEADDGDRLEGQDGKAVLEEWDVDIDDVRRQATVASTGGRKPPKLVHKLMFSMPAWDAARQSACGRSQLCARRVLGPAPIRVRPAHRRGPSTRPSRPEIGERAGRPPQHQEGDVAPLALGVRTDT